MQLRADQLTAHLATAASKGLRPVYTLYGDEALLVQEAADAVRAAARAAGFTERQTFTVAGAHFDWSAVQAAAGSLSLFASRQLIEIRIPSGKPGKDGSTALQAYCEQVAATPADELLTLVLLPRLDRTQQASAWFQALDAAGVTVRLDPVERAALPQWIAQRLAAQGQRVRAGEEGQRTLAFFADRVEGNLLAAHQEVMKLGLLHPPGELGFDEVQAAVLNVARYNVFKLGEAVLAGDTGRALRMLDGLRAEGEAAVLVHWTLAEEALGLKRARAAVDAGQPLPMVLRELRVWGAREAQYERIVPRLSARTAGAMVDAAAVCDGIVKGLPHPLWPRDPWAALARLAQRMARVCRPPERSPAARPSGPA